MRLGKRERQGLREKKALKRAQRIKAALVGPYVKGICCSCSKLLPGALPAGKPARTWGWDWREHLSSRHNKVTHIA